MPPIIDQAALFRRAEIAGVGLIVLAITMLLRRVLLRRLERHAAEHPKSLAAVLATDLPTPLTLWCLAATVAALVNFTELSPRTIHLANNLIISFLILSITIVASTTVVRVIHRYGETNHLPFAVAGLSRTLAQAVVFAVGLMVLLRSLGVSITPVLTALGVGGLAVALALQDTLANLFAGVHILVERPINVGDFVRLSSDEEGTVVDIGWRTTRLLTTAGSTIVIPNKTITTANLLNYSMPDPRVAVGVPIMVALEADIAKVSKIAIEAALSVDGVTADPPPVLIADPGMQPTHLQYKLYFQIPAQIRGGLLRTQVINRILDRFRAERIPLPEAARMLPRKD